MARKKPLPRSQRKVVNRAREYKRDDTVKNVSVGLMDMDSAIMYYFENVIKPTVIDNEEIVKVPVLYASPERWFAIQKNGYLRDAKRQLILPAIVFRRTGFARDDAIAIDKLDANDPKLHYTFEKKYSDKNRYDNFSVQQGIVPQREYYNVAVPDYVTLSYDFIIWTHYIEHMNKIAEKVNWSDGAYWGEPGKMKFRTRIDNFTDATEVSDRERVVKTEFSITLYGYLIPESFNDLITTQKYLTPKRLVIKGETDIDISSFVKLEEGVQEVRVSGKSASSQRIITENALILGQGTGITVSNSGVEWIGAERLVQNISIGQPVGTTDNVIFNDISASNAVRVGETLGLNITKTGVTGDWAVDGILSTTQDLKVNGNATILGDLTAQSFNTELVSSSVIYESGSTKFGDTELDTHQFTGSLEINGRFTVDNYTIDEISNDTTLTDTSTSTLVTENAIKSYVDNLSSAGEQTYLRKQYVKKNSSLIGNSTASFTAVTASAPAGLTATSENDFLFFLNGQYMEHDALTIQQASSTFYLKVDTDSIGYVLETDDEIISWGKFNS